MSARRNVNVKRIADRRCLYGSAANVRRGGDPYAHRYVSVLTTDW
jgi:hypothetical protein